MKRRKTGEGMKKMRKTPEKQYQLAVDGIRPLNVQDSKDRLLAFCMDVSIMLCPIALWNIILLAVLGNIISISGIKLISIFIGGLLVISITGKPADRVSACVCSALRWSRKAGAKPADSSFFYGSL